MKTAALVIIAGAILISPMAFVGCRSLAPDGVYCSDKVLYQAELTITTSYDVVNTFLKWELENHTNLVAWPEIRQGANKLRTDYPHWYRTANVLRDAYKAAPSDAQEANLNKSLVLLRTALAEASAYMARAAGE